MGFITDIKNKIGRFLLNKEVKTKSKTLPKYTSLQNISIVYDAENKVTEEQVNLFASELRNEGKKVFLFGFVNQKQLPSSKKLHITSEFFWKEQLSFFNLPIKHRLGKIVTEPYDLLINLYFDDILPLQAISTFSKAKFKIGSNSNLAIKYNDLLIDTGNNKNIYNLAHQMQHYLKVIS